MRAPSWRHLLFRARVMRLSFSPDDHALCLLLSGWHLLHTSKCKESARAEGRTPSSHWEYASLLQVPRSSPRGLGVYAPVSWDGAHTFWVYSALGVRSTWALLSAGVMCRGNVASGHSQGTAHGSRGGTESSTSPHVAPAHPSAYCLGAKMAWWLPAPICTGGLAASAPGLF